MASRIHPVYVTAAAAYVIGFPLLANIAIAIGVFDVLLPAYTVFELMDVPTPRGLTGEQAFAYAGCAITWRCELTQAAYMFVPLAIVWSGVKGLLKEAGVDHKRPKRPEPLFTICLVACLVLLPVSRVLVFSNLIGEPGLFTYGERWAYVPMLSAIEHVAYAIGAWLAAHHCVHIYGRSQFETLFPVVRAGADQNAERRGGGSPLQSAAERGDANAVATRVSQGADLHARQTQGVDGRDKSKSFTKGDRIDD